MHTSFSNTEVKSRGRRWPPPSPLPAAHSPRVPSQSFLTTTQAFAEHKPPRSRQSQNSKRRQRLESYSYSLRHRHCLSVHLRGLKKGFSCRKHLLKGGLWKCPGVFDCLSSGLGVISEFIGERTEMLNRLKFSGWCPQPRTAPELRDCWGPSVYSLWRTYLEWSQSTSELHFSHQHKVFVSSFQT